MITDPDEKEDDNATEHDNEVRDYDAEADDRIREALESTLEDS